MKNSAVRHQFGETIRQERLTQNISQEDLAEKCGLHRTYIGSVERGERNLAIENIVKISSALGLKASELLKKSGL